MSQESLTHEQHEVIRAIRHAGFAVIVFYPSEVGSANPRRVEDRLTELGNEVIDNLKD